MKPEMKLRSAGSLACDMEAAVSAFTAFCDSKNLSPRTIEYYAARLASFRRRLEISSTAPRPSDVTPTTIREFLRYEKEHSSASTANHSLCTLKVFFGFLHNEGFIESNPTLVVQKQKVRKPVIQTLSMEQVDRLVATCKKDFYGVRDRAILLVLIDTGLRASELCGIALSDLDWSEQTIRVVGKGDKERIVPFGSAVRQALRQYVIVRGELETNALFVGHYGDPIDRSRLREIVRRRCERAGIRGIRPSPHTLRHTAAVSFLRAGGDTFTLQKLLGHTSQEMTRRYCESLSTEDVQRKHRQFSPVDNMSLSVPAKGRKRLK